MNTPTPAGKQTDGYLFGPKKAWFAYTMTLALMLFDYVDRQIVVSLFPYIKVEWGLSDKQLGSLVSIVSLTIAISALPVALIADRRSRVKSIVAMATMWSLATISCMFARGYGVLLAARAMVGLGEAGYGPVGSALVSAHFPDRMRSAVLGGFLATASVGSVVGVALGGMIAAHWGWKAAFGVVGVPGLILSLLYLKVRDYRTVDLKQHSDQAKSPGAEVVRAAFSSLKRSRTLLWVCVGAAVQLIALSSLWSWLPSYLNRVHGLPPEQAAVRAAIVVLCGALGSVLWGVVCDKAGTWRPRARVQSMALLCIASTLVLGSAFGLPLIGVQLSAASQYALIALGGFFATCTTGAAVAVVLNVVHPGFRSTGAAILGLCQNLLGLALGPLLTGVLSDAIGLGPALAMAPVAGVVAASLLWVGSRYYEHDVAHATDAPDAPNSVGQLTPRSASA